MSNIVGNRFAFKVSVIIATYRRYDSLLRAVKSLINQTYSNIEIVVIDDNADTDWNKRIKTAVDKIQIETKSNIILIQNKVNQGSANTRNIGVRTSTGDYVTFLDDDDVYLPSKIETQLNDMLIENADYSVTDIELFNSEDKLIERRTRAYIINKDSNSLLTYHLKYHITGTDTIMFKRTYFDLIGGFPGIDVGDEFYLMEKAILGNGIFCYSKHCFVKAYIHEGEDNGLSSGIKKIHGENELFDKKKQYFNLLSKQDIKFITMRHYAVISFAYFRSKHYLKFMINALKAFFTSPKSCFELINKHR